MIDKNTNSEEIEMQTELKSVTNRRKLKELTEELGFVGLRFMIDPQSATSPEAVIEDICSYLEEQKMEFANSELMFTSVPIIS